MVKTEITTSIFPRYYVRGVLFLAIFHTRARTTKQLDAGGLTSMPLKLN